MKKIVFIASILALTACSERQEDKTRLQSTSARGIKKPLVILHDGPGLTYTYMAESLAPLQRHRKLVFYDQISCYHRQCSKSPVTINDLSKQLEEITSQYGNNFGVLAHGWSSILLMHYLSNTPKYMHPDEVILVTPMPFSWENMVEDVSKLSSNFSKKDKDKLEAVNHPSECLKALKIGLKYTIYDKKKIDDIYFDQYDCMISEYIMGTLTNYDYRFFEHLLPTNTIWITGEKDYYTLPQHIRNENRKVINKASHYPFIENQNDFLEVTTKFLSNNQTK